MKIIVRSCLVIAAVVSPVSAQAQQQVPPVPPAVQAVMNASPFQPRSDWGCEVLLCMANPNGPTAVNECRPPIERLWRHLARGHAFPTCNMSNGQDSRTAGTWVQPGANYYNLCPAGTRPLTSGAYALASGAGGGGRPVILQGFGDGSGMWPNWDSRMGNSVLPPMACVGTVVGTQQVWHTVPGTRGDDYVQITVNSYDNLVIQQPTGSPRIFDVYINNQVYHRARP